MVSGRTPSAVALGVLPLTILGVIPSEAPLALAVLGVTGLLAFSPEGAEAADDADAADEEPPAAAADGGGPDADDDAGREEDPLEGAEPAVQSVEESEEGTPGVSDGDRAPWL